MIQAIRSIRVRGPQQQYWLRYDERRVSVAVTLPGITVAGSVTTELPEEEIGYKGPGAVATRRVLAINAETGAVATYAAFPLDSLAQAGARSLAVFSDGIYELGAATDAGDAIAARLRWAPSDLGSARQKRMATARLNLRGGAGAKLVAVCDEREERIFTVPAPGGTGVEPRRVAPTALEGRYWQMGVDVSAPFDLYEIEIIPAITSKHGKG